MYMYAVIGALAVVTTVHHHRAAEALNDRAQGLPEALLLVPSRGKTRQDDGGFPGIPGHSCSAYRSVRTYLKHTLTYL